MAKCIKDLPLLRFLLLANNSLTNLPFNPSETNKSLRRLTLNGNKLDNDTMKLQIMDTLGEEE